MANVVDRSDTAGMRGRAVSVVLAATVGAGCATTGVIVPQPFPRPGAPEAVPASAQTARAVALPAHTYAITATALSLRGVPYRDGGTSPSGFDCSGFTHYVYEQHGIDLPRLATNQFEVGTTVDRSELEPGDLVFFATTAPGPSHVGMSLGGEEFVHAPSQSGEVRVERLSARYWSRRWVGAKRVVTN